MKAADLVVAVVVVVVAAAVAEAVVPMLPATCAACQAEVDRAWEHQHPLRTVATVAPADMQEVVVFRLMVVVVVAMATVAAAAGTATRAAVPLALLLGGKFVRLVQRLASLQSGASRLDRLERFFYFLFQLNYRRLCSPALRFATNFLLRLRYCLIDLPYRFICATRCSLGPACAVGRLGFPGMNCMNIIESVDQKRKNFLRSRFLSDTPFVVWATKELARAKLAAEFRRTLFLNFFFFFVP